CGEGGLLGEGVGEHHKLRFFTTAMTDPGPGLPWFVSVGYVDGEIFVHYDSTTRRTVPRTEWMAASMDQQYWDGQTEIGHISEPINRENLVTAARLYNRTGGSHTVQRMSGCDILEDNIIRGYYQIAYDGRDFIAFDKDTMTFTAAVPEAVPSKRALQEGDYAEGWKHYLEKTCPQWLRRYVEHGRQSWGGQVRGAAVWGWWVGGSEWGDHWVKDGAVLVRTPTRGHRAQQRWHYHTWITIDALRGSRQVPVPVEHASLPQPTLPSPRAVTVQPGAHVVGWLSPVVAIAIMAGVGFIIYRRHAGKSGGVCRRTVGSGGVWVFLGTPSLVVM
uniref:MHC class I-like antigen recognition-like domain-containing protein n=1 Tax=Coturnix japonica TaxID=93934 RepID=A0A8C2TV66_COTJA